MLKADSTFSKIDFDAVSNAFFKNIHRDHEPGEAAHEVAHDFFLSGTDNGGKLRVVA
jgi:hypothetical protein